MVDLDTFVSRINKFVTTHVIVQNNHKIETEIIDRIKKFIKDNSNLSDNEIFLFDRQTAEAMKPFLDPGAVLVSASKGIERGTSLRLSQVLEQNKGKGEFAGKSWKELDRAGKLSAFKAADPEAFKSLYRETFGTDYKE